MARFKFALVDGGFINSRRTRLMNATPTFSATKLEAFEGTQQESIKTGPLQPQANGRALGNDTINCLANSGIQCHLSNLKRRVQHH